MKDILPFEEIKKITFSNQPMPIPAELRPVYKIYQIIIMINICGKSNSLSFLKLQYLNWILKDSNILESVIKDTKNDTKIVIDFLQLDPKINFAIDYAIASKIVFLTKSGSLKLTPLGESICNKIYYNQLMQDEINILKKIGNKITEDNIKRYLMGAKSE